MTAAVALCVEPATGQVLLNEILASNRFTNFDEDGDSPDWIELYNAGAQEANVAGYGLSDDSSILGKWVFPDVSIPPGGHLLVWASGKDRFVPPAESISGNSQDLAFDAKFIAADASWRYLVANPGEPGPPAGWNERDFNDVGWPSGEAGFGYGDGDDATILPDATTAVFTRRTFQVPDPGSLANLVLQIDYDDGFAAYLNGVLVASSNAPAGDPDFSSTATGKHEAGVAERFDLTAFIDRLVAGANVLAIVGLNTTPSSDMSVRAELGVVPLILHANFQLNREGEILVLSDSSPQPNIIDGIAFPVQTEDHSYGRVPSGSETAEWRYFLTPTPGAGNGTTSFHEPIADSVDFRPAPGKYSGLATVSISTTLPGITEIRYTRDGSEPTASSPLYAFPLSVTENTVFRAAGFIGGERSTRVTSSSYFIDSTISLPILSLSMDPDDYATVHNNASGRGRASERAATMEYFDEAGRRVVHTGLGLRLHGGAGRGGDFETKKAYRAYFRGIYGDKKLHYPIIPETPVEVFDKLVLRSAFNDSFRTSGRASYLRDELIRDLHQDMGATAGHGSWCILYVNMKFRGLFNIVERLDDDFLSSYFEGSDWDVIKTGNDVLRGSRTEWDNLRNFAVNNDLSDSNLYSQFLRMLDLENYTSYMLLNMWAQNHDWPHNNWYAARERSPGAKWIFLSWDAEFGVGLSPSGWGSNTFEFALGRNGYLTEILKALLDNPGYRDFFMRELDRYSWTALSPSHVTARIDELHSIVRPDIPEEVAQFGRSFNDWMGNVNQMAVFADRRGPVFTDFLRSASYDFPVINTPIVTFVSPASVVNTGDVEVTLTGSRFSEETLIYFGRDPAASIEYVSGTRLRATLPFVARLEGSVEIIAVDPQTGGRGEFRGLLSVDLPVPEVEGLSRSEGPASGGEDIVIFGNNFMEGVEVLFGAVPSPRVTRVDKTVLSVLTPPGEGVVEVRVVNHQPAELAAESILYYTYERVSFVRGDSNLDGQVDLSDAVRILAELFLGGDGLGCLAAADANASRSVDLSDAVAVLSFLFTGGDALPAPFPACGGDPSPDALPCDTGPLCSGN